MVYTLNILENERQGENVAESAGKITRCGQAWCGLMAGEPKKKV